MYMYKASMLYMYMYKASMLYKIIWQVSRIDRHQPKSAVTSLRITSPTGRP
jgi:hypothetical protein